MPQLPGADLSFSPQSALRSARSKWKKAKRAALKSHRLQLTRLRDMPLRIRPWFVAFTVVIILFLGLLGFTNVANGLVNDKLLHFFCLGLATGVFYWCFEVEEEARRIWIWRNSPLALTVVICFFFGGIVSEFVQALLPYKTFDAGDILANLVGCSTGLAISYQLERYHRHRKEIAKLYQPVDASPSDAEEDDELDDLESGSTLPFYRQVQPPSSSKDTTGANGNTSGQKSSAPSSGRNKLGDVWTSREELFALGDEDDEEGGAGSHGHNTPRISSS